MVTAQRDFRIRFHVDRHVAIPTRRTIMKWVRNSRTMGNKQVLHERRGLRRTLRGSEQP